MAKPAETLSVGQRIKMRRHLLNMKQEVLAMDVGFDRSTISRIETGELVPQRFQVELIAKALQCSLDSLSGG